MVITPEKRLRHLARNSLVHKPRSSSTEDLREVIGQGWSRGQRMHFYQQDGGYCCLAIGATLFSNSTPNLSRGLFDKMNIHDTPRMGIHYFIVTIDESIPWSLRSPHAPIAVRLSLHRPEPILRYKRYRQRSPF
jgi:hypothetical protein